MFEGADLLEAADAAVLEQIRDRELCDRYENEITEAEYLQGLLEEHRREAKRALAPEVSIEVFTDAEPITRLIEVEARARTPRAAWPVRPRTPMWCPRC